MSIFSVDGRVVAYTQPVPRTWLLNTFAPVNTSARLWVGADNTADASREGLVMNVMKTARTWTGHITGQATWGEGTPYVLAVADAQGYPQSWPTVSGFNMIETFILTNQDAAQAALLNGRYRFTYDGVGTLEVAGSSVSNVSYSPGLIEFDYNLIPGTQVSIRITAITEGNHPRNFAVYHTKYAARIAAGYITRPDYDWKGVRLMRFLGWTKASDNGSGYPTLGDYTWGKSGMPPEAIAQVCNEMGVEPYVTIPTWFNDAQITAYATALRNNLNPLLGLKVEWTNETWNPVLYGYQYCVDQANALFGVGAAPDQNLQYAGLRAAQCMNLFSAAWAGQTARLTRIFGVHTGWVGLEAASLDAPLWVALGNPAPVNSFDALAVTGYFGGNLSDPTWSATLANTLTTSGAAAADAQLLAYLNGPATNEGTIAEMFQQWQDFRTVCNTRGLDMIMYEGNSHLIAYGAQQSDPAFVTWLNNFNYSATMGDIYRQMMIEWDTVGDGPFNLFVGTSGPSQFGAWGVMRYPGDSNPRTVVAFEYNTAPLSQPGDPQGGQTVDTYAHLNSLHNHDAGAGNLNTSTANWIARMAAQAPNGGNVYTCGWQFGFANGWTTPPNAQGQEVVTSPHMSGTSWTGGNQIEVVEMVPDNFEGWTVAPNVPNSLGFTYTTRLLEIIDAWEANAPNANRKYRIYVGWRLLNGYGSSTVAGMTAPMLANWISDSLGSYQAWFENLESQLQAARPSLDIGRHDVNRALMLTYRDTVVSTIPATALFEDMAPHGYSTWYFLAAIADYIEMFNEKPPANFVFDGGWGVHSTVTSNYQDIVDFMWNVLRP